MRETADKIFPYPYVQEDLPNGLRLITIPTDYPNIVSLFIVVGAGSRNEVAPAIFRTETLAVPVGTVFEN